MVETHGRHTESTTYMYQQKRYIQCKRMKFIANSMNSSSCARLSRPLKK